jgi:HEPN domain-containing protein
MNTKIRRCNEDAAIWIERSRNDYEAAKLLKTKDPALAIYLLQQCIEKSVKALAIASGKFDCGYLKSNSKHDSKRLLKELWRKLDVSKSSSTLSSILDLPDMPARDLVEALQYTIELTRLPLFSSPFNFEQNDTLRLSLRINGEKLDCLYRYSESPPSLILEPPLERSGTKSLIDLTIQFSLDSGIEALVAPSVSEKREIKASLESQFLKDKLVFALFFLAALTSGHETSTRYPRCPGDNRGCQDYTDNLPIVKHMGLLYEILDAILPEVDSLLKSNLS